MKVLFISRASLYQDPGGDTVQVINTALYLRKSGIEVEIKLTNEPIDYSSYDLLHFFNIIRPADILLHIRLSKKPFVVSPIFVDYSEYDKQQRKGLSGSIFKMLSPSSIEYAKIVARWILSGEKIMSREYLWLGHRRSILKVIKSAALLLPNSDSEYQRLKKEFQEDKPYIVVPNGINPDIFAQPCEPSEKEEDLVLCVARIEGRKNQLNLIKALNNTRYRLLLIGKSAVNQKEYYFQCRQQAAGNISFIDKLTQPELVSYYKRAKVHVLPSWFETTGLSSLEAAVLKCNIVITDKGDTREYFGEEAIYCNPASVESIYNAVNKAAASDTTETLRDKVLSSYTWEHAAKKTLEAYNKILNEE